MSEKQILIILGTILLGGDNVTEAIKRLPYVHIENEILRFIFIACRSLVRNGKSVNKKAVLQFLRKETFTTARQLVAYNDAIDLSVQEASLYELQEKGDIV